MKFCKKCHAQLGFEVSADYCDECEAKIAKEDKEREAHRRNKNALDGFFSRL